MDQAKNKALEMALSQIEKQFGKGAIMRLGSDRTMDIDVVSTGSLGLDIALGVVVCHVVVSLRSTALSLLVKPH